MDDKMMFEVNVFRMNFLFTGTYDVLFYDGYRRTVQISQMKKMPCTD